MDDYEERLKKLQAAAVTELMEDLDRADMDANIDPVRMERKLFVFELGRARHQKKISQAELAAKTGMRQADISRIENAKANPSLNTLLKIAKALDANLVLEYQGKP